MSESTPAGQSVHSHEPNPITPEGDGTLLFCAGGIERPLSVQQLRALKQSELADCWIASTGHPRSGPFRFGGTLVCDLLAALLPAHLAVAFVDFVSADNYGTRLHANQLASARGPLLATKLDGHALRRDQGLVRLIVPTETTDALHQVKWVARIEVTLAEPS